MQALTEIGGGYALMADRRLTFLVDGCDGEPLTNVMAQIVGRPERQEALKAAIKRRQNGDLACAWIVPSPAERIYRHPDLIDALEKLEMCDEYEVSDNPAKRAVVGSMRRYWEEELARLGGVPKRLLQRDLPDREDA